MNTDCVGQIALDRRPVDQAEAQARLHARPGCCTCSDRVDPVAPCTLLRDREWTAAFAVRDSWHSSVRAGLQHDLEDGHGAFRLLIHLLSDAGRRHKARTGS